MHQSTRKSTIEIKLLEFLALGLTSTNVIMIARYIYGGVKEFLVRTDKRFVSEETAVPGYSLSLYGGTYVLQDTPLFSELFS